MAFSERGASRALGRHAAYGVPMSRGRRPWLGAHTPPVARVGLNDAVDVRDTAFDVQSKHAAEVVGMLGRGPIAAAPTLFIETATSTGCI